MSAKQKAEGQGRRYQTSATYVSPPADQMVAESITEQHGYIPLKTQVKMLLDSGRFLDAYRKEYYDTMDFDDIAITDAIFDEEDPTINQNYDIAEAAMVALELEEKAKWAAQRAKAAKKAAKEKKDDIDYSPAEKGKELDPSATKGTDKNVK